MIASASVIYQYSTVTALISGDYHAITTVGEVSEHSDFGLGAGVGLGELVILDGDFYIAGPQGEAIKVNENTGLSYVTATRFKEEKVIALENIKNLRQLEDFIDAHFPRDQTFYAMRIDGIFNSLNARSERRDEPPYTPIVEWMKHNENKFTHENLEATLIIFRTPEFMSNIGVVGYHIHFLSKDKKLAGHVLDLDLKSGRLAIQKMYGENLRVQEIKRKGKLSDKEIEDFRRLETNKDAEK